MVFTMNFVVNVKILPDLLQRRFHLSVRHSPLYQFAGPITNKTADLIDRTLRESVHAQRVIRSFRQIRQRIQQRAVQIKNDGFVLHSLPLPLYP